MKKLLIAFGLLFSMSFISYAEDNSVAISSFTPNNDTLLLTLPTSTNTVAHILSAIIVSSATPGGILKIYNSTYTTSNQIAAITLGTVQYQNFGDVKLKGIYYVTTGNSNGVTIIYKP